MSEGNVLLADDNKLVVKITSAILEDAGYEVSVAWDGLEAINKAYTEEPDLVILDIEMPKINGYQVCRLLKDDEFTRDIPVIMLTGRDQQTDMFWGMKTGADAYMTKGFKPEQLISTIKEKLEEGKKKAGADEREGPTKILDEGAVFGRVIDLLDSKLFESTILNDLGALAGLSQDYKQTVDNVLGIIARVLGNSVSAVVMFEEEEMIIRVNLPTTAEDLDNTKDKILEFAGVYGLDLSNPERIEITVYGEENVKETLEDAPRRQYAYAHVALTAQKKVIGVLVLAQQGSPGFAREAQAILEVIHNQITIVVDNARLYEAARKLAITDGLTRLYNHRFFQELFEKEFKRSDRYKSIFSLIMLDIDHFKKINDTYGHLCGDEILKGLANLIKGCLRSMDVVARYGGEEFAILLPETNGQEAAQTAERIRRTVDEYTFMGAEPDQGLKVTVSQGVTTYPSAGIHGRFDIIAKADEALYEAKESGRNRVCFKE